MQAIVAGMLLIPGATGCYSYRMASGASTIAPGTYVSLSITDRGRVGLNERMGSGVLRLSGTLRDASDSLYVVNVESVEYLGAGKSHWSGESVRVPNEYVGSVSTRTLSKKRSWLMAGLVVGAIALIATTISLIATGLSDDGGKDGGGDPGTS
jgi:hypothetical protein